MTMSVMEAFDNDMQIPFIGFGAKLPPFYSTASSCFAVNGDIFKPECNGVQGIMDTYDKGIHKIEQHGPSAFSSVIDFVTQFVGQTPVTQNEQFYSILVIITNGSIQDYQATVNSVVEATKYPISIVIVTVGSENISKIRKLDGDDNDLVNSNNNEKA